jgi:hypothetical protein
MNHHSNAGVFKLAFSLIFVGGGFLIQGLKRLREARLVSDTASSPIASAPQGRVDLQGFAWKIKELANPFEDSRVLYFEFEIEECNSNSRNSNQWTSVYKEKSTQPFAIVDRTGFAVVYPLDAEFELRETIMAQKKISPTILNGIRNHLMQKGSLYEFGQSGFFSRSVRFKYKALFKGSPLNILGTFQTLANLHTPELDGGLSHFFSEIQGFKKNIIFDLKRFDKNHDETISQDEWFNAYIDVASKDYIQLSKAGGSSLQNSSMSQSEIYMHSAGLLSGTKPDPLIIADCHKEALTTRLSKWNWTRIFAGASLVALGATILFLKANI